VFIAIGVSVANLVAQHVNLRRYVTGTDVPGFNLDFQVEWWWGLPFGPLALWSVGAVAFTIAALCLAFGVRRTADGSGESDSVDVLVPGVASVRTPSNAVSGGAEAWSELGSVHDQPSTEAGPEDESERDHVRQVRDDAAAGTAASRSDRRW
jgi:hypothetical protein